jgi:hypothetical protein
MKIFGLLFFWYCLCSQSAIAAQKAESTPESGLQTLIPNSINYEITSDDVLIRLKDRPSLHVKTKELSDGLGGLSRLGANITLGRTSRDFEQGLHFVWSPFFSLAFYNFEIDSKSVFFPNTDFQFFRVMAGFGPQLRLTDTWGTLSLLIAPAANYSWVSWSSPVSGGSFAKSNFNIGSTLNYLKPLNDKWNFQAFVKVVMEDSKVWKEAMSSSQGFEVPVQSVVNTVVGIAFGYSW